MKNIITTILLLAIAVASVAAESSSVPDLFSLKLSGMLDADTEKSQTAMKEWEEFCFAVGAPGKDAEKKQAIALMCKTLGEQAASKAHFWMLRQLARLGDESCLESVAPFLDSPDRRTRDEAFYVLGNLPGAATDRYLAERLKKETNDEKKIALENTLKYRSGRKEVKLPTLDEIVQALENAEPDAADFTLPKSGFLEKPKLADVPDIENRFKKLSAAKKVLLLDALTKMRDVSAVPFAKRSLDNTDETVRLAAIRMLGPLGGSNETALLAGLLDRGDKTADTACDSLARLDYDGADRELIELYEKQENPQVRKRLIDALSRRRGTIALPLFEQALDASDDGIRLAAINALALNGEAASVSKLVDRFYSENRKEIKDRIFTVLVDMLRFSNDRKRAEDLLFENFQKRSGEEQSSLIPLFGKIGGDRAKALLLKRLEGRNDPAAFNALCDWPDASAATELYEIASDGTDTGAGKATRSYLRMITLPAGRKGKDSVELFEKGISVSKNDDDKKFLLSRLGNFRNTDVLGFIERYLDDPVLADAARRSLLDQCNDFWFHMNNRERIDPLLDKIIGNSKDVWQVDRAKQFKARRAR